MTSGSASAPLPTAQAAPTSELPAPRLVVEKAVWNTLKKSIERDARILCFRYPKPSPAQVRQLVTRCIGFEVRKEDAYYQKGCAKVWQNVAGWKYETIEAMIRWVKKLLLAKPMLANIREDKLYDEMRKNYDSHAAEAVFQHVAGHYQMHVSAASPAGIWIQDFFANLAVMVKLHLDDPHSADSERAVVLDFYDMFGRIEVEKEDADGNVEGTEIKDNSAYARIKLADFPGREDKKPRRSRKVVKRRALFGHTTLPTPPESPDDDNAQPSVQ